MATNPEQKKCGEILRSVSFADTEPRKIDPTITSRILPPVGGEN